MASAATLADAFARVRALGFVGSAMRLADIDLPRLGHWIGVGEDEIHAVIDVETAGGGFDKLKRPKMLFEPHRFYANLPAGPKRDAAVAQGLAYPKWRKGYPSDSFPRLFSAMQIDETEALKSASWGLGQIMGENYVAAGYESPQQMVLAFVEGGEAEHLEAMINFIVANHLDDELRAHNWVGFARGYNGSQYAKNAYDTKLAAAFARWAKIKDTPWSPETDVVTAPAAPTTPVEVAPMPPITAKPAPAPAPLPPITVQAKPNLWARIGRWIDDTFGDRA